MPWMVPVHQLDPDQKNFIQRMRTGQLKNTWVKGFAGSGKSVLLAHALVHHLEQAPERSACVVLYTRSLIDLFASGLPQEAMRGVPVVTYHQFRKSPKHYDLILVDEVQDLPADVVRLLKENAGRLVVAGDEAQSIYDDCVVSSEIPSLIDGETYALTVLHRLTGRVIEIAQTLFPDKRLDQAKRQRLKLVDVTVARAEKSEDEVEYVWRQASQNAQPGFPVTVLVPSHALAIGFANAALALEGAMPWTVTHNRWGRPDFGEMNAHLRAAGLPLRHLGNGYGSLAEAEREGRVILMTYHSAKGLDFETVYMPYLSDRTTIWRDDEERSKTLFYVALTRSRLNLTLSHTGEPHRFVKAIPDRLVHQVALPIPDKGRGGRVTADADEIIF